MPQSQPVPDLRLDRASHYKAPPVSAVRPFTIQRRTQVVEIVTQGTVYFRSGSSDLKLGCGALFWHVAGEKTIHRTSPSSPYECLALLFVEPPAMRLRPRPPRLTIMADRHRTLEMCSEFLRWFHDPSVGRRALSRYVQARLLWEIHLGRIKPPVPLPASLERACALIEQQFPRAGFGVAEIARMAEISEPHLHVLFRKHLGQTPHQFLTSRRLREAKLFLSSSTKAIKQISAACGFLNIETFYRAFAKHGGVTPNQFRQTHSHPMMLAMPVVGH